VFVPIEEGKGATSARSILDAVHKACSFKITRLLTDTGPEFTDRLFASPERTSGGHHEFGVLCRDLRIEHWLTPPRSPQTNGLVGRFKSPIGVVLQTLHFNCALDLNQALLRYTELSNHQLPQSVLLSRTTIQAMKQSYEPHPELFNKRTYNGTGVEGQIPEWCWASPRIAGSNSNPNTYIQQSDYLWLSPSSNRSVGDLKFLPMIESVCSIL